MTDKKFKYAIFIIVSGFLTRLMNITQPLFEVAGWRQCDTASIARNFYYNGMNIFYPQILAGGATNGIIGETEFHLYPGAFHASEILAPEATLSKKIWKTRYDALNKALYP